MASHDSWLMKSLVCSFLPCQAVWRVDARDNQLTMTHTSQDGDQGYPGSVQVSVTFTLTDQGQLLLEYKATSDKATPINLTTHPYFNLAGHAAGDIYSHHVTVHADHYLPVDDDLIPTGELTIWAAYNKFTIFQQFKKIQNFTSKTSLL